MFTDFFTDMPASSLPTMYFPSHGLVLAGACPMPSSKLAGEPAPHGHVLPDTLRCGYTSKRCENPRTVKKSGGLHRFCAYHRERANKNQWRVDNRRRVLKRLGQSGQSAKSGASDCESPRSNASESLDDIDIPDVHAWPSEESNCHQVVKTTERFTMELEDLTSSPNTLSEQDALILNALLFSDEDEKILDTTAHESTCYRQEACMDDANAHYYQTHVKLEHSVAAPCICSQCVAWSTMFFYRDAMQQAQRSRHHTYARV